MLTKEEIASELLEKGTALQQSFLWFGKNPESGEPTIQQSQAEYNAYVRHLNSLGIDYEEELNIENMPGPEITGIVAVVFKINTENKKFPGRRNEYADFFNIEYNENEEFIIIKIHYSQPD